MHQEFQGYYRPTKDEFKHMWAEGIIALDANVLLDLYRYSESARDSLLGALQSVEDRLWLPHQVVLEFLTNRADVISQQRSAYERLSKLLEQFREQIGKALQEYGRHPFIDKSKIIAPICEAISQRMKGLDDTASKYPDFLDEDPLLDKVTKILDGKVGQAYDDKHLGKIRTAGEERYAKRVPPGYRDGKKGNDEQYGDLIVWNQILDHAETVHRDVILVTGDIKEDWWLRVGGRTVGPRLELTQEFYARTGAKFWLYQTERFIEYSGKLRERPASQEVMKEIREVREDQARIYRPAYVLLDEPLSGAIQVSGVVQGASATLPSTSFPIDGRVHFSPGVDGIFTESPFSTWSGPSPTTNIAAGITSVPTTFRFMPSTGQYVLEPVINPWVTVNTSPMPSSVRISGTSEPILPGGGSDDGGHVPAVRDDGKTSKKSTP